MPLIIKYSHYLLILLTLLSIYIYLYVSNSFIGMPDKYEHLDKRLTVAVLGDSDSHSYRDTYDNKLRGGIYNKNTYNWFELWNLLSKKEINSGEWGAWGNHYRITKIKHRLGIKSRSPRKLDYKYNYSLSGLKCDSLFDTWPYQGQWLLEEIRSNPVRWSKGLVIIRIGINDIGNKNEVTKWAKTGLDEIAQNKVTECVNAITTSAQKLKNESRTIKIALIGVTRSYNFSGYCCQNLTREEINNIENVLQEFDKKLIKFSGLSENISYIDDHYWFNNLFGSQENQNLLEKINYDGTIDLYNKSGDFPNNILLSDDHTGTLYNGLWVNHLISVLNKDFQLNLSSLALEDVIAISGI